MLVPRGQNHVLVLTEVVIKSEVTSVTNLSTATNPSSAQVNSSDLGLNPYFVSLCYGLQPPSSDCNFCTDYFNTGMTFILTVRVSSTSL